MGFFDWLKQAGKTIIGGIRKGVDWVSQKIVQPVGNFFKKVPLVGDVVRAFEPAGNVFQRSIQTLDDKAQGKQASFPTVGEYTNAFLQAKKGLSGIGAIMNR